MNKSLVLSLFALTIHLLITPLFAQPTLPDYRIDVNAAWAGEFGIISEPNAATTEAILMSSGSWEVTNHTGDPVIAVVSATLTGEQTGLIIDEHSESRVISSQGDSAKFDQVFVTGLYHSSDPDQSFRATVDIMIFELDGQTLIEHSTHSSHTYHGPTLEIDDDDPTITSSGWALF